MFRKVRSPVGWCSYPRFMSVSEWRPLSWRREGVRATAWRGEVPAPLSRPLREWMYGTLRGIRVGTGIDEDQLVERVMLRLDLVLPEATAAHERDQHNPVTGWRSFLAYDSSVELLLDVVDAVLDLLPAPPDFVDLVTPPPVQPFARRAGLVPGTTAWVTGRRAELDRLFGDARSVMRVQPGGRGLERRSDALAELALGEAVGSAEAAPDAGSAAGQLRVAWGCVYALRPHPVKGYSLAVKAVESAAHAVVEPRRAKATLGTMLGELRANRDSFSLVIGGPDGRGDVGPLIGCLTMLWEGQSSRHGSSRPTRDETLAEAVMAVHLAVMLVQWFTSGAVRRSSKV
jgi:hypothetical protein